ncbi:MAG: hypothetical protein GKR86_00085 [Ilumatobacter sp.]|nr:hypothetical protein [Ilumatobacter sp.]
MSERGLPPYPLGGDWLTWARQLVEFLSNEARSEEFVAPRVVGLSHQTPNEVYRAIDDGLMMFDSVRQLPVFSLNGVWVAFGGEVVINDPNIIDVSKGYQVWGDLIIQWGSLEQTNGSGADTVTFPKAYKLGTTPTVAATAFSEVDNNIVRRTASPPVANRHLSFDVYSLNTAGSLVGNIFYSWISVGEADDADKLPSTVGGAGGAGAGPSNFISLTDTPASYTGAGLEFVRVNVAEDALEFFDPIPELSLEFVLKDGDTMEGDLDMDDHSLILTDQDGSSPNGRRARIRQENANIRFERLTDDGTAATVMCLMSTGSFTIRNPSGTWPSMSSSGTVRGVSILCENGVFMDRDNTSGIAWRSSGSDNRYTFNRNATNNELTLRAYLSDNSGDTPVFTARESGELRVFEDMELAFTRPDTRLFKFFEEGLDDFVGSLGFYDNGAAGDSSIELSKFSSVDGTFQNFMNMTDSATFFGERVQTQADNGNAAFEVRQRSGNVDGDSIFSSYANQNGFWDFGWRYIQRGALQLNRYDGIGNFQDVTLVVEGSTPQVSTARVHRIDWSTLGSSAVLAAGFNLIALDRNTVYGPAFGSFAGGVLTVNEDGTYRIHVQAAIVSANADSVPIAGEVTWYLNGAVYSRASADYFILNSPAAAVLARGSATSTVEVDLVATDTIQMAIDVQKASGTLTAFNLGRGTILSVERIR